MLKTFSSPRLNKQSNFTPLTFGNRGVEIANTNFWNCDVAKRGLYFLSCNAGGLRLLVPDGFNPQVPEHLQEIERTIMATVEPSVVRKQSIDLVFEDGTQNPFFICLHYSQTLDVLPQKSHKKSGDTSPLLIYTSNGLFKKMEVRWAL